MFAEGSAVLPYNGMGAIAQQLKDRLLPDTFVPNTPAKKVQNGNITFTNGKKVNARAVLLATDAGTVKKLIGNYEGLDTTTKSVKCLYFSADTPPTSRRMIVLNGTGKGWVNNLCVPSTVSPNYAPPGRHLVSITIIKNTGKLNESDLADAVRREMEEWFGISVRYWNYIKTYDIAYALPADIRTRPMNETDVKPVREKTYVCGDHTYYGALDGAMVSARHTANAIADYLAETL